MEKHNHGWSHRVALATHISSPVQPLRTADFGRHWYSTGSTITIITVVTGIITLPQLWPDLGAAPTAFSASHRTITKTIYQSSREIKQPRHKQYSWKSGSQVLNPGPSIRIIQAQASPETNSMRLLGVEPRHQYFLYLPRGQPNLRTSVAHHHSSLPLQEIKDSWIGWAQPRSWFKSPENPHEELTHIFQKMEGPKVSRGQPDGSYCYTMPQGLVWCVGSESKLP